MAGELFSATDPRSRDNFYTPPPHSILIFFGEISQHQRFLGDIDILF